MDRLKKIFRYIRLSLIIILISLGVGLSGAGPVFTSKRLKYSDKEITTEMVERKEDESDIELNELIE